MRRSTTWRCVDNTGAEQIYIRTEIEDKMKMRLIKEYECEDRRFNTKSNMNVAHFVVLEGQYIILIG